MKSHILEPANIVDSFCGQLTVRCQPIKAMCFFNVINWQVISFQLIAGLTPGGFLCSGYKFIV